MKVDSKKSFEILKSNNSAYDDRWQALFTIADNIADWSHPDKKIILRRLISRLEDTDLLLSRHPRLREILDAVAVGDREAIVGVHDVRLTPSRAYTESFLSDRVQVNAVITEADFTSVVNEIKKLPGAQPETCNYLNFLINK